MGTNDEQTPTYWAVKIGFDLLAFHRATDFILADFKIDNTRMKTQSEANWQGPALIDIDYISARMGNAITTPYMAPPEKSCTKKGAPSNDHPEPTHLWVSWSFGADLYRTWVRKRKYGFPFPELETNQTKMCKIKNIKRKQFKPFEGAENAGITTKMIEANAGGGPEESKMLEMLVKGLMRFNDQFRFTFDDFLCHIWTRKMVVQGKVHGLISRDTAPWVCVAHRNGGMCAIPRQLIRQKHRKAKSASETAKHYLSPDRPI